MKKLLLIISILLMGVSPASAEDHVQLARKLSHRSVNVLTRNSVGSGTIVRNNDKSYILTCGHVIANSDLTGKTYPVRIYQNIKRGTKLVRQHTTTARVLHYSPRDGGYDLALLETKDENFGESFAKLQPETEVSDVGSEVFHIGNFKGYFRDSFTTGHISFLDRNIGGGRFRDQISLIEFEGSSGAGVFNKDGILIGIVSDKSFDGVSHMIPARAVRAWLKEINLEVK